MAFRFQKRIKLLPGITLNLSKKGVSTSLGVKGARVTYGHGKRRTTVGLPGSGISHTSITSRDTQESDPSEAAAFEPVRSADRTRRAEASGAWLAGLVQGLGVTTLWVLGVAVALIVIYLLR